MEGEGEGEGAGAGREKGYIKNDPLNPTSHKGRQLMSFEFRGAQGARCLHGEAPTEGSWNFHPDYRRVCTHNSMSTFT